MHYHFHIYDYETDALLDQTNSATAASFSPNIVVNGYTGEVIREQGVLLTPEWDEIRHREDNKRYEK